MNEHIFISKKTGKIYLFKENSLKLDIEKPIEVNMSEYKFVEQNNSFSMYEKTKPMGLTYTPP